MFLDTGVLGVIVHPRASVEARECLKWVHDLVAAGARICVAEICDYELRRELERRDARVQIGKLNALKRQAQYVPIDTDAILAAANMWAKARNEGHVTAPPEALDGDVILCAQAKLNVAADEELVVATTNAADLRYFLRAEGWRSITV